MQLHGEQNTATNQMNQEARTARIRALNDEFRQRMGLVSRRGRLVVTEGVGALPDEAQFAIMAGVATFNDFKKDNDPWQEHDFGAFDVAGQRIFWKIDYYTHDLKHGSPDPSDEAMTCRVITVMLASEY